MTQWKLEELEKPGEQGGQLPSGSSGSQPSGSQPRGKYTVGDGAASLSPIAAPPSIEVLFDQASFGARAIGEDVTEAADARLPTDAGEPVPGGDGGIPWRGEWDELASTLVREFWRDADVDDLVYPHLL